MWALIRAGRHLFVTTRHIFLPREYSASFPPQISPPRRPWSFATLGKFWGGKHVDNSEIVNRRFSKMLLLTFSKSTSFMTVGRSLQSSLCTFSAIFKFPNPLLYFPLTHYTWTMNITHFILSILKCFFLLLILLFFFSMCLSCWCTLFIPGFCSILWLY